LQPPEDRDAPPAGALWTNGGFAARVVDPSGRARVVHVSRPFAVAGRAPSAAIRLGSPGASLLHLYLHLGPRGLFAVDLASRTGTRFDGDDRRSGWTGVGRALEVAGWRIEPIGLDVAPTGPPSGSPIEDEAADLVPMTLVPDRLAGAARSLGSELVFLGRGACCGLRVDDSTVARVHAVLVRTGTSAFVVDLAGTGLARNGRPVRDATPLEDGDLLVVGRAAFHVRLGRRPGPPALRRLPAPALLEGDAGPATSLSLLPAPPALDGPGASLVAWVLRAVQLNQGELLRRQDQLRETIEVALREQSSLLRDSIERMARIDRELAELREELRRSTATVPSAPPLPAPPPGPLRLPRLDPAEAAPRRSTDWLLDRVQRLEEENRSTWRDLLGRLVPAAARTD